ncbi:MAG: hypothetical protein WCH79_13000, partial [Planctomycetia bacterium]
MRSACFAVIALVLSGAALADPFAVGGPQSRGPRMLPYGARLGGLTALSEEQIIAFVTHGQPGHGLSLDGLTELSTEQARSLRLFLGPLSLNG